MGLLEGAVRYFTLPQLSLPASEGALELLPAALKF